MVDGLGAENFGMSEKTFREVEDLQVYLLLCDLHIAVCECAAGWPKSELYELGSQVRRSSNSSPSQLAEKHDDRHVRNKIEGVNRARGEAGETIHHLFMAHRRKYIDQPRYAHFKSSYKRCIRMLNGLEKSLEKHIPANDRRWPTVHEDRPDYGEILPCTGYPEPDPSCLEPGDLNPEL
jgi:four helix bundle protein